MKTFRIILLVLIIVGIGLLLTQKIWVPKLVQRIIRFEDSGQQVSKITEPASDDSMYIDSIRVDFPLPGQTIQNPLVVKGVARGNWFFEGNFPVVLTNWDGLIVGEGVAQANGNWMTTNFVPFEAKLTFTVDQKAYSNKGALTLRKDNPSGLPQNDAHIEVPILFKN